MGIQYCEPPLWWRLCAEGLPVSKVDTSGSDVIIITGQSRIRVSLVQKTAWQSAIEGEDGQVSVVSWDVSWRSFAGSGKHSVRLSTRQLLGAFGILDHIREEDQGYLRTHWGATSGESYRFMRTGDFLTFPGPMDNVSLTNPAYVKLNDEIRTVIQDLCSSLLALSD